MTDRELLELAARAAWYVPEFPSLIGQDGWNPLTDDGDALRLAVKLRLCISITLDGTSVDQGPKVPFAWERSGVGSGDDERAAATRRAIVRAAAEIGKQSKG